MANLKDLKNRIGSVKSTQKITRAMQMVAAAKLRRATERAAAAKPYAEHMENMLLSLAVGVEKSTAPTLLSGTGNDAKHLIVVMSSDRGLCGGFNSSIVRSVKKRIDALELDGKQAAVFCIGSKGHDQLNPIMSDKIIGYVPDLTRNIVSFEAVQDVSQQILDIFADQSFDTCTIVYNAFKSAISQIVTYQQLIPLDLSDVAEGEGASASYEYEPEENVIMEDLLPRNISVQIFKALLENVASEQGSRMSAMDNATRNAGDMIKDLELLYNRSRQATITSELIEIISGAEAV